MRPLIGMIQRPRWRPGLRGGKGGEEEGKGRGVKG